MAPGRTGDGVAEGTRPACGAGPGPIALPMRNAVAMTTIAAAATGSPISGPGLTSTVTAGVAPGRTGDGVAEGTSPACGAGPGPIALPIRNADRAFYTFMGSLSAVFVALFIILNVMMSALIVRPITKMSEAANEISTGNMDIPEFSEKGGDEVSLLARSFNRMRKSLDKAISLIGDR